MKQRSIFLLALLPLLLASPASANPFAEAMNRLAQEDVIGARPMVVQYELDHPNSAQAHLLRSRLHFLDNDFAQALESLNAVRSTDENGLLEGWERFEALVESTWDATRAMKQVPATSGHFIFHVTPGQDEVLLPYAEEALEKARKAYEEIFGTSKHTDPVHVHFYPKIETLAAVSSLKVTEIQNSGTIALCKYNRLMVTSPRDLLYGYNWLDTLAHEYIHYVISKRNEDTVPIWIHEGLAKFFENRWREPHDNHLEASSQDLLAKGLKDNALISFEAMSPSMAKLPTQEATGLAFAEVFTVMQYIKNKVGVTGIRVMLDEMKDGKSDREAVSTALGVPFSQFEKEWKKWLKTLDLTPLATRHKSRLYFKNKNQSSDELESIGEEEAEKYTYLGDLLRARERYLAASKEYEKAAAIVGETSPVIQSKRAATYLSLEQPMKALEAVKPPLSFHPDYVLLRLYQGRAHLALEQFEDAVTALEKAVRLNPFDAEAHARLVEAYKGVGNKQGMVREQEALRLVDR